MTKKDIRVSIKQAIASLKMAEQELHRPRKDMVTLSVCLTARNSMSSLMQIYLHNKAVDFATKGNSLSALLNQCKKTDKQFDAINVENILCNESNEAECEHTYCLSTGKVAECFAVANKLKSLVLKKLEISESELE